MYTISDLHFHNNLNNGACLDSRGRAKLGLIISLTSFKDRVFFRNVAKVSDGLRMRKIGKRDLPVQTIDEVLANRWAKTPEINALDILKKSEQKFQADMVAFAQTINENCATSENTVQLLELVACMQQTSEVISETHSNINSEWPWKNTSAIYNRFFALMSVPTKTESELFFISKKWGLRLDMALLQRMNDFLFKILERPFWLRFFLHTAYQSTAFKDSECLEYALTEMDTLASGALDLAGINASLDGYSDMISLEKKIDTSKCLAFEMDSHRKAVDAPPLAKRWFLCAGDFILIGTQTETASGNGSTFHLRYAPVPIKFIISRQFDLYGSLENVIEMNLRNSVLIAVQTDGAADRQLLAGFLNSAKQSNKMLIKPKFWLIDKPAAERGAVLYTKPVTQPIKIQMTKPLDTADTVIELRSMLPAEMRRISYSAPTVTDKKAVQLVSGWVARQMQFFNELAQRSTTPATTASTGVKAPTKKVSLSAESESNSSLKEAAFSPTPAPAPGLNSALALVSASTPAPTATSTPVPAPTQTPQPAHTP
ncbi:hypothetical protein HDU77_008707 [Chytriomyces hyalinus]|nr:hypothetical protein HDU77_008707 [Chytriomyces hyalinus]